jgi:proton-dependent oligopeptide transporter, POT family
LPAEISQVLIPQEKSRLWGLIAVCVISVAFWAAYEQQGNTIALWADAYTDRHICGWEFPASWVQSMNPAFVFLLTPLITAFWARQSRKEREPSAVTKMVIGCLLLGASFLVMVPAARAVAEHGHRVGIVWLMAFTLVATLGELYLSPVGLSLVTKVAPVRMVSTMMGVWFLSSFVGNYAAGFLGTYWEKMPKDAFFLLVAAVAMAAGLAIRVFRKPLKRAMSASQAERR